MQQIVRERPAADWVLIYAGFLILLSLAYLPLLTSGFLFHDDFVSMIWIHNKVIWDRNSIAQLLRHPAEHPLAINNMQQGRWGAFILNPLQHYWLTIHTSPYIRFVGVMLLSLLTILNFYWFKLLKYPPLASFTLAVALATLPPFQACIFSITCESILFATVLAQCAAISIMRVPDSSQRLSIKILYIAVAIILLLMSQFTYTLGSSYFLVFLLIYLLAPGTELNKQLLWRCVKMLGFFFAVLLIFYGEFTFYLHMQQKLGNIPIAEGRGISINPHVLGQIKFYLTTVIPRTVNFWNVDAHYHPHRGKAVIMTIIGVCASIAGAWELLARKSISPTQNKRRLYGIALLLMAIIVPLSIAPVLASVPGQLVFFRTLQAHMTMFFVLVFWGFVFTGTRLLRGYRHIQLVRHYASLTVIAFSLVCCTFMLERYIVRPMNFEHEYVRSALSGIKPSDNPINIAIRPDPYRVSFIKDGSMDDDSWGVATTPFHFWDIPLVLALLHDQGIATPQAVPVTDKHVVWEHGQITILAPSEKPPQGAILIDMSKLFTLGNGLQK